MKEKPNDLGRLQHIEEAIEKISKFIKGYTFEKFQDDDKTYSAVVYQLAIVGEATYHIDKSIKAKYPNIPWKKIEGMRHIIVHDYYYLKESIIWEAASVFAIEYAAQVKKILEDIET